MTDRWIVGVDIGGTNLMVGAVPWAGGRAVGVRSAETHPQRGAGPAVDDIARLAADVMDEVASVHGATAGHFVGVGIGCPGPLDLTEGLVIATPNLRWNGFPIRDRIADALDLPATLDNDANCATYGEWWQGAAQGASSVIGVTLGTGIGGGLILGGELVRGASGCAGEIGHTTIDMTGRRCACGNYGCLEAYASGPNIAARAREGLEAGYRSTLSELVDGDLDRVTAATVYEALTLGDAYAREVMVETAKILGTGLANLVNTLNPECIVIVGGVTRAGRHLFDPLRAEIRRRAFPSAVDACRVVAGGLPETSGVVGAAGIFIAESKS